MSGFDPEPLFLEFEEKIELKTEYKSEDSLVNARDVDLHLAYHNVMSSSTLENQKALQAELTHRINTE